MSKHQEAFARADRKLAAYIERQKKELAAYDEKVRQRIAEYDAHLARRQKMIELHDQGKTLAEIGALFGVTRERVRQIIVKRPPTFSAQYRPRRPTWMQAGGINYSWTPSNPSFHRAERAAQAGTSDGDKPVSVANIETTTAAAPAVLADEAARPKCARSRSEPGPAR